MGKLEWNHIFRFTRKMGYYISIFYNHLLPTSIVVLWRELRHINQIGGDFTICLAVSTGPLMT